jgi:hypothetical protein
VRSAFYLLVLLGVGCNRAEPEPVPAPVSPPPAVSTQAAHEGGELFPYRFAKPRRLVAIGDVHGDLGALRAALRLAGAIDAEDDWIGGKLVVVQTGDQLDRGDDDRKILDLLQALSAKAARAGGALHALNGNHETMNVAGDFRYVTPGAFAAFSDFESSSAPVPDALDPRARGRFRAFAPGARYARRMADRNTVVVVGESVFAHGGVLPEHVRYGIGRINADISRWMRGELRQLPPELAGEESPMWTRAFGEGELDEARCAKLGTVLAELGAKRLVIGHTVQKSGISAACGDRVYRIDVGLSRHYGGTRIEVLEIRDREVNVLARERSELMKAGSSPEKQKPPERTQPAPASP